MTCSKWQNYSDAEKTNAFHGWGLRRQCHYKAKWTKLPLSGMDKEDIKSITREYHELHSADKFDKLNEMDKFLERSNYQNWHKKKKKI